MNIDGISRCIFSDDENISNRSKGIGNLILKNLIKIGSELNLKQVELVDASTIINPYKSNCNINLAIYKILTEGQSWYNKHGFKSMNHEKEREQWDKLRQENFLVIFLHFKETIVKKKVALAYSKTEILQIIDKYSKLQDSIFIFLDEYSIKCTHKVKHWRKIDYY